MKKILFMHGGSKNHGCEAIIRTTAQLLNGPKDVQLWSSNKQEDELYGVADLVERIYVSEEIKVGSLAHMEALIRRRILKQPDANMKVFIKKTFKNSIAISVGGDNYCYPWSAKEGAELDILVRSVGAKTVLWGCSLDEEFLTPEVRKDLALFDLITARESLTYRLVKPINPNTVWVADPAFLLEKVELPLPEGFLPGNTVGINVSPLIMEYGNDSLILQNYEALIEYILTQTDMIICLIPHVVWENNDDLQPIEMLRSKYSHSGRICSLGDHNCMELKGFISRCRFFVGARTHATIAAYSSCIPTLAVGYSVKSKGIALDLFGTDKNYVIPVQGLQNKDELTEAFRWLQENEAQICQRLTSIMPQYIDRARGAAAHLDALL